MSKAPLLRSSSELGAGSYGLLPDQFRVALEHSTKTLSEKRSESKLRKHGSTFFSRNPDLRRRASIGESNSGERSARSNVDEVADVGSELTMLQEVDDEVAGHGVEFGVESSHTVNPEIPLMEGLYRANSHASTGYERPDGPLADDNSNITNDDEDDYKPTKLDDDDPLDNSPYAQVRASVSATDDITSSINTPRMWALSLLFAILGSATNLFFSLRYPSVSITPVIALLLVHPLGRLWDLIFKRPDDPPETFINGTLACYKSMNARATSSSTTGGEFSDTRVHSNTNSYHGLRLWLAQGRWNEKEHACVYIGSNVSFGFAFATDVIVEQTQFYRQEATIAYQLLLILSTQILGYAIAGLTRRYLVRPSGMIWPSTLIPAAMFTTLHKEQNRTADGWVISRWRFFLIVFLGSFSFYFLPGFLMPALSFFNVITWLAPRNVVVANLFGVVSGLGLFPVTFDWSQITYTGSPLIVPFWAAMNVVGGLVVVMWIVAPIMYYANILYSAYMPILSASVFDNTGVPYDVTKILTADFLFDETAYHNYSRVFLPMGYLLSYGVQFASLTALITHTICWHGKDIWTQTRQSFAEARGEAAIYRPILNESSAPDKTKRRHDSKSKLLQPELDKLMGAEDVHNRLMRRYEDVPISWYLLTGVICLLVGMFVVEYYPIHLPWYGLLLALSICLILFIPIGIVMAITSQQSSIYLICQLACGLLFPGRPVANMLFVTYGYITSTQALKFSADLKLGHYAKIPPRTLFAVQLAATVAASFTQIGVLNWMLANVGGICTPAAVNGFTCPIARVHFNGSILWGVVGPARFFGREGLYRPLVWAFLVGAFAPLAVWAVARRSPRDSLWRSVNLPVVFGSLSWIPPATGLNFSVWALVCFLFNSVVRRRRNAWWRKYNMTLSAALDAGVAFGVGVVFFGIVYPDWSWVARVKWWGTEVYKQGCDWQACPYKTVPEGQHFGPETW